MDDELNILPISSHIRSITAVPVKEVASHFYNLEVTGELKFCNACFDK